MGGVAGAHLIHGQVGGDHRPLVRRQAGVDEGVEGGLDKGGGKLAAQIVQNQQIAAQVAAGLVLGLPSLQPVPGELLLLEAGEDVYRRVVHHGEAALRHGAGDAGREEGLAQPRRAGEEQVAEVEPAELPGIAGAHVEDKLHVLPGGEGLPRPGQGGVVVQGEGVKGLLPQIQQLGQLPDLLLGAQRLKAGAHIGPHPAGVAALGAGGLVVQGVGGIAVLGQQRRLLRLEAQVFIPDYTDGGHRIAAVPQGGGDDLGDGAPQFPVDGRHPGQLGVNL